MGKTQIEIMHRTANEFLVISSNGKTFIPNHVNTAFACEVFMKMILQHKVGCYKSDVINEKGKTVRIWTHDLMSLYNEVVKNVDEIVFLKILGDKMLDCLYCLPTDDRPNIPFNAGNIKRDLVAMLNRHKDIFVTMRYNFENPSDEVLSVDGNLRPFALALKEFSEEIIG